MQIGPLPRRMKICIRRTPAQTVAHGKLKPSDAELAGSIEIIVVRMACLYAGFDKSIDEWMLVAAVLHACRGVPGQFR